MLYLSFFSLHSLSLNLISFKTRNFIIYPNNRLKIKHIVSVTYFSPLLFFTPTLTLNFFCCRIVLSLAVLPTPIWFFSRLLATIWVQYESFLRCLIFENSIIGWNKIKDKFLRKIWTNNRRNRSTCKLELSTKRACFPNESIAV